MKTLNQRLGNFRNGSGWPKQNITSYTSVRVGAKRKIPLADMYDEFP